MNIRTIFFSALFLFAFIGINAQQGSGDYSGHYGEYIQEEGKEFDRGFHLKLENGHYQGTAYRVQITGINEVTAPLENLLIDPNSGAISFKVDGELVSGSFTDDGSGNWLLHLEMEKDELNLTRR